MSRAEGRGWAEHGSIRGMTRWMERAPGWLVGAFENASKWSGISWRVDSEETPPKTEDGRTPYPALRGAEAVGSCYYPGSPPDDALGTSGTEARHIVMLDIDHEAILIPSTAQGHHHLIVNMSMCHSDYMDLLMTMAETGVIQAGYFEASRQRGETFLRLPWVRKGFEAHDARAALEEWLTEDDRPKELQSPEALEAWLAEEAG